MYKYVNLVIGGISYQDAIENLLVPYGVYKDTLNQIRIPHKSTYYDPFALMTRIVWKLYPSAELFERAKEGFQFAHATGHEWSTSYLCNEDNGSVYQMFKCLRRGVIHLEEYKQWVKKQQAYVPMKRPKRRKVEAGPPKYRLFRQRTRDKSDRKEVAEFLKTQQMEAKMEALRSFYDIC